MNDKLIWDYIKNKSIGQLHGYSLDITRLHREVVTDVVRPQGLEINNAQLFNQLKSLVSFAGFLEKKLSEYDIDELRPDEMAKLFPSLKLTHNYYTFEGDLAKEIYDELTTCDDFAHYGLSEVSFVVNKDNANVLFSIIDNTINPDSNSHQHIHHLLNEIRQKLSADQHQRYFSCAKNSEGPYTLAHQDLLAECLDDMFKVERSNLTPLSHNQLWQLSQVFSANEREQLFGRHDILRQDDINIENINWQELFRYAQKYPITLKLEPYQYHRMVNNLKLKQGFDYVDMFLNKAAGFSENTLQSGSQWLAAYGFEAGKFMKILSVLFSAAVNCTVIIQRAIYMPFLALIGLLSAKWNHDAQVLIEVKQRKSTVLAYFNANRIDAEKPLDLANLQRIRQLFPYDEKYLHNGETCYYKILRDWVVSEGLEIPQRIIDLEEDFLQRDLRQELLLYLTQALMAKPDALLTRPRLQRYVENIHTQFPDIRPPHQHEVSQSPFHERSMNKRVAKVKLLWFKFSGHFKQYLQVVKPFIAPSVSAIFTGVAVFTIVFMLTAFTPYLIAAGVCSGLLAGLVGVLRYYSDQKQLKVADIMLKSEIQSEQAQSEQQKTHQHQAFCQIINDIQSGDVHELADQQIQRLYAALNEEKAKTQRLTQGMKQILLHRKPIPQSDERGLSLTESGHSIFAMKSGIDTSNTEDIVELKEINKDGERDPLLSSYTL